MESAEGSKDADEIIFYIGDALRSFWNERRRVCGGKPEEGEYR